MLFFLMNQVVERMSAIFTLKDFVALVSANPDLYGPFWIPTTVIFALFASKNVTQYVLSILSGLPYQYKMSDLSWAFSSVYGFVTFIPAILYGVVSFYKLPLTLLELLDIYGYGMVVWIPVAVGLLFNMIVAVHRAIGNLSLDLGLARFRALWYFFFVTHGALVYFKIKNVQPVTQQAHNTRALLIMASIILVAQAGLAILFKIIFFKEVSSVWSAPAPSISPSPSPA